MSNEELLILYAKDMVIRTYGYVVRTMPKDVWIGLVVAMLKSFDDDTLRRGHERYGVASTSDMEWRLNCPVHCPLIQSHT